MVATILVVIGALFVTVGAVWVTLATFAVWTVSDETIGFAFKHHFWGALVWYGGSLVLTVTAWAVWWLMIGTNISVSFG